MSKATGTPVFVIPGSPHHVSDVPADISRRSISSFQLLLFLLYPELVHASKNRRILRLKNVPKIEVSHRFVVGESLSEILEDMTREVEPEKFQPVLM